MVDWWGVNLKVTLAVNLKVTGSKLEGDPGSGSKLEGDSGSGSKLEGALLLVDGG